MSLCHQDLDAQACYFSRCNYSLVRLECFFPDLDDLLLGGYFLRRWRFWSSLAPSADNIESTLFSIGSILPNKTKTCYNSRFMALE